MPSKIPNEAFLKTSGLAWVTLSTIYWTLKTLSPTANLIARAAIAPPAIRTNSDIIEIQTAGARLDLKQQHI
jgi:hypothetical protein